MIESIEMEIMEEDRQIWNKEVASFGSENITFILRRKL